MAARRTCEQLALRQGAGRAEAQAWAKELVGPVPWSLPALRREWNKAKAEVAPWWAQCSKEAYSSGLDARARALKGFFGSRAGERQGAPVGFPKFKKKSGHRSYRVTTGSFGLTDGRHVRLPRVGVLRTKEPTTKLRRELSDGTARVLAEIVISILTTHRGGLHTVVSGDDAPGPGPLRRRTCAAATARHSRSPGAECRGRRRRLWP